MSRGNRSCPWHLRRYITCPGEIQAGCDGKPEGYQKRVYVWEQRGEPEAVGVCLYADHPAYLLGKPVFFKGCFIVYQDEENTSLYRVFSFKNRYPKMTEILVTGDIEVISVDADNNGIFIRSAESLFFITSNYEKDLILSSQSRELHKVISQLKGYDHVVDFSVLTVASKDRYSLEAATSNGKTKNLDVYLSYGIYTFNLW